MTEQEQQRVTSVVKALDILLQEMAPRAGHRVALWDEVIRQAELFRIGARLTAAVQAGEEQESDR